MPRNIAVLRDFSGGVNTQANPRDIQDNQLGFSQDAVGDRVGSIRSMGNGSGTPRQIGNSYSDKSINTLASTDLASSAGYGFKHFELDWTEGGANTGEHYLAVVDESGELNLWDYTNNSWATVSVDISGDQTDCKPIVTAIGNGIRVADTNLTNASQIKYYMYVKRSQLGRDRSGFYAGNNTLPPPSAGNLIAYNASLAYTDGSVNFKVESQTAGTGTWAKDNYAFAYTFIYDGNQESAPFIVSSALATANVNEDRPWKVTVCAANATAATDYDARITGARIYWKYYDSGLSKIAQGEWNLLVDVDLTGTSSDEHAFGIRSKLGDKFTNWSVSSNDANAIIVIQDPPIDTYATLNGYRSSDGALVIGNASDGYKSAVFTNRRMFVANVKMTGADGVQTQEADRIMYSPVNKPDIFPASQFIDVVKGDAEPYIKLESVGDRLFAFKGDNLFILNIASPNPSGWYLEATHRGMGVLHPAAVFKADFGIIWINPNGLFVYQEGGGIAELTEGKILNGFGTDDYGFKAWGKLITSGSIVGYSQKDKEIIINIDCSSTTNDTTFGGNGSDVIVYDMETQSFWFGKNKLTSGGIASNFEYDWNGDLIYASEASDTVTIRSWQSDSQTSTGFLFSTKDVDFGSPGKKKKIYNVYVTYKHSDSNTVSNFLSYSTNGSTSFVTVDGDGSTAIGNNTLDQATSWEIHKFTFATPVECQSLSLRFNGPTSNASKISINDISVEFREVYGKVPST
tara:strand:+ start:474 stop:2702 length:2229 start_codon:yes stop_codon:yes gene_type:complete